MIYQLTTVLPFAVRFSGGRLSQLLSLSSTPDTSFIAGVFRVLSESVLELTVIGVKGREWHFVDQ